MKTGIVIAVAALTAVLGWHLAGRTSVLPVRSVSGILPKPVAPTSTLTDPTAVFQKAFWNEWADADGIQRWQWFIAVEPSTELVQHLITGNAFGLAAVTDDSLPPHTDAPGWFPRGHASDHQVLVSSSGSLVLDWDKQANRLHATDSGGGFRPGGPPLPPTQVVQLPPTGRLPASPPPRP